MLLGLFCNEGRNGADNAHMMATHPRFFDLLVKLAKGPVEKNQSEKKKTAADRWTTEPDPFQGSCFQVLEEIVHRIHPQSSVRVFCSFCALDDERSTINF